jgi:hypothetical protein
MADFALIGGDARRAVPADYRPGRGYAEALDRGPLGALPKASARKVQKDVLRQRAEQDADCPSLA